MLLLFWVYNYQLLLLWDLEEICFSYLKTEGISLRFLSCELEEGNIATILNHPLPKFISCFIGKLFCLLILLMQSLHRWCLEHVHSRSYFYWHDFRCIWLKAPTCVFFTQWTIFPPSPVAQKSFFALIFAYILFLFWSSPPTVEW